MKKALVRYGDQTAPIECPYGHTTRIVTGGEGGVANVHVVEVTAGGRHRHTAYDEVYFVLAGKGALELEKGEKHPLRPGAVAVIPAGTAHSLQADPGERLKFVIFGSPAMDMSDSRAAPQHA